MQAKVLTAHQSQPCHSWLNPVSPPPPSSSLSPSLNPHSASDWCLLGETATLSGRPTSPKGTRYVSECCSLHVPDRNRPIPACSWANSVQCASVYLSVHRLSVRALLCRLACSPSLPCVPTACALRLLLPVHEQQQATGPSHRPPPASLDLVCLVATDCLPLGSEAGQANSICKTQRTYTTLLRLLPTVSHGSLCNSQRLQVTPRRLLQAPQIVLVQLSGAPTNIGDHEETPTSAAFS